jgi:hypothetical protein
MQKFTNRAVAFVMATAAAMAIIWALYGIQEGAVFDLYPQNMLVTGEFVMQTDTRPQDATRFRLQPGINLQSGRVSGTIIQAL